MYPAVLNQLRIKCISDRTAAGGNCIICTSGKLSCNQIAYTRWDICCSNSKTC